MATFNVQWNEDGSATVLGRITAKDATGAATGVDGEGKWLQQADISTITCKVFHSTPNSAPAEFATPTVTVADAVLDTPVTTNVDWVQDEVGYNFEHDLAASNFPSPGQIVAVEYEVTLTGGTVFHGRFVGAVDPIDTS